jgi:hypothetical protein
MSMKKIVAKLEQSESEFRGHAKGEKLSGNVVKESLYNGTAAGIRIAACIIEESASEAQPDQTAALSKKLSEALKLLEELLHVHRFSCGESKDENTAIGLAEEKAEAFLAAHKEGK